MATSLSNLARVVTAKGNLRGEMYAHTSTAFYKGSELTNNKTVTPETEAERLNRQCLSLKTAALGPDHPSVAITLNNLAQNCRAQGSLDEAETLYRQAAEVWDGVYGEIHPLVATVLNNLGLLVHQKGNKEQAEELLRR